MSPLRFGADWPLTFTPAAGTDLTNCANWALTVQVYAPDGALVFAGTTGGGQVTAPDAVTGVFTCPVAAATTLGYAAKGAGQWAAEAWRDDAGHKAPLALITFPAGGTHRYPAASP